MSSMEPLDFLQSIAGFMQAGKPGTDLSKIKLGTVDPAYIASTFPGTLPRITFDGETTMSTKTYPVMSPYWPQASDRVILVPVGATYLILGPVDYDTSAYLGGQLSIGQSGIGTALMTRTTIGSVEPRFVLQSNGQFNWGNGTNPVDTNLYRSGTNQLKTDDSLEIVGTLVVGGVIPGNSSVQTFTANGTWTKPSSAQRVRVRLVGAGGSGGGSAAAAAGLASKGGGGGGGCYAEKWFTASTLTTTVAVTIGLGPTGVSGTAGTTGGTTSFGAFLTATGGLGGTFGGASSATWGANGGVGGSTTTGTPDLTIIGHPGHMGFSGPGLGSGGAGGSSALGGGAGGTQLGSANNQLAGINATGYGGGGGGAITAGGAAAVAAKGGDGGDGVVVVETFF